MAADSEGTWEIGVVTAAQLAASDFGQWSPTHDNADDDKWATADSQLRPVSLRALKRAATQVAAVCSGERQIAALDVAGAMSCGGAMSVTGTTSAAAVTCTDLTVRTGSGFSATGVRMRTDAEQIEIANGGGANDLATLATLGTVSRAVMIDCMAVAIEDGADNAVAYAFRGAFFRQAGGTVVAFTPHLEDTRTSGAGAFVSDVTFDVRIDGTAIKIAAYNGGAGSHTANVALHWTVQEGGQAA